MESLSSSSPFSSRYLGLLFRDEEAGEQVDDVSIEVPLLPGYSQEQEGRPRVWESVIKYPVLTSSATTLIPHRVSHDGEGG